MVSAVSKIAVSFVLSHSTTECMSYGGMSLNSVSILFSFRWVPRPWRRGDNVRLLGGNWIFRRYGGVVRLPLPLWLSPSLGELLDLLGRERLGGVTVGFVGGSEGVGRVIGVAFVVDGLVAVDAFPTAAFVLGFERVVFAHPVGVEIGVGAGLGEFDAGHFLCPFLGR